MSTLIHGDYYQDILETRYCLGCQKRFIVGEELAKCVPAVICPYCGSSNNEAVSWSVEDLGCGSIGFHKNSNRHYDRCLICGTELNRENIAAECICMTCEARCKGF